MAAKASLREETGKRILLLDGAMGTMIQARRLSEAGRLADLLCLTRPDVVSDIHRLYLEAGADIITTNTFSSQRVSLADYGKEALVREINREAARIARAAALEYSTKGKPRFVVASIGPTGKSLSISPDVEQPAARAITYDELQDAYIEQMTALLLEGVDGLLLETIFDTLNAKAGIDAAREAMRRTGRRVPLMLSVTVSDKAGRTLSGQTLEAFLASVSHASIFSVGLNCSFGARDMLPFLRNLARKAPYYISAHPNAGLPNALGGYDQTPEMMLEETRPFVEEGLVNIIGGCCGTTPRHIALLASLTKAAPHKPAPKPSSLWLSGLELLDVSPEAGFVNVGERCNVAGSRKFLRLIREGAYDEALSIARRQVEDGALALDINMDDGLLDAPKQMRHFLLLLASDPDVSRVPVMIDSSSWQVVCEGLRCLQGKGIVNSISLKEGETVFLSHAEELRRLGAAAVVMAFDERGQATTFERRIEVCQRAYRLLVDKAGFPPTDIIFDPNVLAVATGMPEHDGYALDFLRATEWIRKNLPQAHVSGGVSNLSFAFRGNDYVREAMHAVFLYHARRRGMDFGIVNPAAKVMYSDIPVEQLRIIEDALLRPSPEASERLIELAQGVSLNSPNGATHGSRQKRGAFPEGNGLLALASEATPPAQGGSLVSADGTAHICHEPLDVKARLVEALRRGNTDNLEADLSEALRQYPRAVDIIEGPLMEGMTLVGRLFQEGKMFLPQVVKTARAMKRAVSFLKPHIEAYQNSKLACDKKPRRGFPMVAEGCNPRNDPRRRVLLATVRGDVHDIGKNIVSVVMACNGFEVVDLGVMTPAETIAEKAKELRPDIIGLSGLVTPSLEEMRNVVALLEREGVRVPVMIGGATTSRLHTALKIAPLYSAPVIWVKDATENAPLAQRFLNPLTARQAAEDLHKEQEALRLQASQRQAELLPLEEARRRKPKADD